MSLRGLVAAVAPWVLVGMLPAPASGQGAALTVDFKRAPLGSWAEYSVKVGTDGTGDHEDPLGVPGPRRQRQHPGADDGRAGGGQRPDRAARW